MSLSDLKISQYEKDLKIYKEKINKLSSDKGKTLCINVLDQIEKEMDIIQKNHDSRNGGYMSPLAVRENITRICNLRIRLDNLINQSQST